MSVMPGPEVVTWSSSPNGPAVVYEYITNTNESNPALLTAAAVLLRPFLLALVGTASPTRPFCFPVLSAAAPITMNRSDNSATRLHEGGLAASIFAGKC